MKFVTIFVLLIYALFVQAQTVEEFVATMPQDGFVTDLADVYSNSSEEILELKLTKIQQKTGIEYGICTIDSIPSHLQLNNVATALANSWGVGNKTTNNGVLFLVDKANSDLFIATGNGTEKYLPNKDVQAIINSVIVPEFKNKNYFTGTANAIDSLQIHLENTPLSKTTRKKVLLYSNISIFISFGLAIVGLLWLFNKRRKKKELFGGGSFSKGNGAGGSW